MQVRRVIVASNAEGRSAVVSDGAAPRAFRFQSLPGFEGALLWSTPGAPTVGRARPVDASPEVGFVPGRGETRLLFVTFPPDSVMTRAEFDGMAFGQEFAAKAPGLAETFEPANPGMHTTDSIDYDVVLDGEITLELDGGAEVTLKRHEVVVQHGTRHAWRNRTDRPATLLFVLIGAARG